jgi:pyrroline-5-carboxylate reductase
MATLAEELAGAPVGFVGAGNMAWAIFQNILASGIIDL